MKKINIKSLVMILAGLFFLASNSFGQYVYTGSCDIEGTPGSEEVVTFDPPINDLGVTNCSDGSVIVSILTKAGKSGEFCVPACNSLDVGFGNQTVIEVTLTYSGTGPVTINGLDDSSQGDPYINSSAATCEACQGLMEPIGVEGIDEILACLEALKEPKPEVDYITKDICEDDFLVCYTYQIIDEVESVFSSVPTGISCAIPDVIENDTDIECNGITNTWTVSSTTIINGVPGNPIITDTEIPCDEPKPFYVIKRECIEGIQFDNVYVIVGGVESEDPISTFDTGISCSLEDFNFIRECRSGVMNIVCYFILEGEKVELSATPTDEMCLSSDIDSLPYVTKISGNVQDTIAHELLEDILTELQEEVFTTDVEFVCNINTQTYDAITSVFSGATLVSETSVATDVPCTEDIPDHETVETCNEGLILVQIYVIEGGTPTLVTSIPTDVECNPDNEFVEVTELCANVYQYLYDNTTVADGFCGQPSFNIGLNPNATEENVIQNNCDTYNFPPTDISSGNLNAWFDDIELHFENITGLNWDWGLITDPRCFRFHTSITDKQCLGIWSGRYRGNYFEVKPRIRPAFLKLRKEVCYEKVNGELLAVSTKYFDGATEVDNFIDWFIGATGYDAASVNNLFDDESEILDFFSTNCVCEPLRPLEGTCADVRVIEACQLDGQEVGDPVTIFYSDCGINGQSFVAYEGTEVQILGMDPTEWVEYTGELIKCDGSELDFPNPVSNCDQVLFTNELEYEIDGECFIKKTPVCLVDGSKNQLDDCCYNALGIEVECPIFCEGEKCPKGTIIYIPCGTEPDCPQIGTITPIGSRPIARTFGDIGNGNAGPHVINDFTGPITLEACETGDFQNNGIVSNAFNLGLTGTAPQTCVTVNQTAACAQGTAFVLFQDTPSGGIALPAISSGTGNWQNLGPYAYDSSTGTDVVTTQLCYNTTGVDLTDLVFVGFGTGGFGSDTGCCDSYTLTSDIAECEIGGQTEMQIDLPIDTCYTDACCDGAARITRGRPNNNPMTWEYNGISGGTFEEFISNLQASGYNTYVTNQNGTGDGTESLEAHWLCPAVEGEEITINGVPIENGLYEFPNPLIALDCESKIDERLKVSLKQQDIEAIANALADKPQTGVYQFCVGGQPVVYCIEGKSISFYQGGKLLEDPSFHDCLCYDTAEFSEECPVLKFGAANQEILIGCEEFCSVGSSVTVWNPDGTMACTGTVTIERENGTIISITCPTSEGQFVTCQ